MEDGEERQVECYLPGAMEKLASRGLDLTNMLRDRSAQICLNETGKDVSGDDVERAYQGMLKQLGETQE